MPTTATKTSIHEQLIRKFDSIINGLQDSFKLSEQSFSCLQKLEDPRIFPQGFAAKSPLGKETIKTLELLNSLGSSIHYAKNELASNTLTATKKLSKAELAFNARIDGLRSVMRYLHSEINEFIRAVTGEDPFNQNQSLRQPSSDVGNGPVKDRINVIPQPANFDELESRVYPPEVPLFLRDTEAPSGITERIIHLKAAIVDGRKNALVATIGSLSEILRNP